MITVDQHGDLIAAVSDVLKRKFTNLTVKETVTLSNQIIKVVVPILCPEPVHVATESEPEPAASVEPPGSESPS